MDRLNIIKQWFISNNFEAHFIFGKINGNYKCSLYMPLLDREVIGYGASRENAKRIVVNKAYKLITNNQINSTNVEYHLEKRKRSTILHVIIK